MRIIAAAILIACGGSTALSQEIERTSIFNQSWLKTLVSIEVSSVPVEQITDDSPSTSIGSGFLVETPNHHTVLITAKHVVFKNNGNGPLKENLVYRLNGKGKSRIMSDKSVSDLTGKHWLRAPADDIAYRFMAIYDDQVLLDYDRFLPSNKLEAGTPLFVIGYPMGIRSTEYSRPIVRKAMVSRADADGIIADGFVFPGNSGGPVIYEPPIRMGGIRFGTPTLQGDWFAGMVTSYIPYTDVAVSPQTQRARISFEENSGLFQIVSADKILNLLRDPNFVALDAK